jgi:thiol:disulfide interchange protein DsbD
MLTNSSSLKASFGVLIPFSFGRVVSYTSIAVVSFYSAIWIKSIINNETISQSILGSTTIIIALFILFNSSNSSCCSSSSKNVSNKIGYFILGFGISLNPCIPVMSLISVSINANELYQALLFGAVFGIGAISASFIVFGIIVSKMAKGVVEEFAKYKNIIEKTAGVLLLIVGISTLNGWLKL